MNNFSTIELDGADEAEALLERSVREQWGDGLPLIAPTRDRIERALDFVGLDPDRVIGVVTPKKVNATIRNVTVNAIMAGCTAEMLPLVFAATEAMCFPDFGLQPKQVTTHPVGVASFVSGSLSSKFAVNSGINAFGPGNRTNACVGRAIRLIQLNLGGAIPGVADQATFGSPAKYTWFFGENQEASPWASWASRRGVPEQTIVTTVSAGGFQNMLETTSSSDELLRVFARSMATPTHNDLLLCGAPVVILCPEHARVLADSGLSVEDVQDRLWEEARLEVKYFSDSARKYRLPLNWGPHLGQLTDDTRIPMCVTPADFHIVVSGGPGRHSVYIPGFGRAVTHASVDSYIR